MKISTSLTCVLLVLFPVLILTQNEDRPCPRGLTVDITNGTKSFDESITYRNITYPKGKYYNHVIRNKTQILGCKCDSTRPCFRKCCPIGLAFKGGKCQKSNHTLVQNFNVRVHKGTEKVDISEEHFTVVENRFCEHKGWILDPDYSDAEEHYVQDDGSLYRPKGGTSGSEVYHKPEEYCMEVFEDDNMTSAVVCFSEANDDDDTQHAAYSIGMMISLPFLLVTFLVYACVPELQNLHGKSLMCYVISLLIALVFLLSVQKPQASLPPDYCVTAPFIIYFAFMVSFLWLNVMCIDIWWTFSGRRGIKGSVRQSEKKRFLIYSAYAWGVPVFMVSICAVMQFAPNIPENFVRPHFGEQRCWFADEKAVGCYFYGPILALILSNMGLFAWTTYKIWTVQRDTEKSMQQDSQRHGDDTDKQRYKLYLKLMLVFGVNWLMEIVSWLASGPQWLWYVTDMCNALYGVFIFFIFVCKANVWKLVKKRYHSLMGRPYRAHSYAPTSSTRSTGLTTTTTATNGQDTFALNTSSRPEP